MNDVLCEGALNEVMNKLTRGDRECVPLKSVVQVLSRKHGTMDRNRKKLAIILIVSMDTWLKPNMLNLKGLRDVHTTLTRGCVEWRT